MASELKKTNCHFCGYLCALLAEVENGRVVDISPDPTRYPYDEQIIKGCRRWRMNLDVLDGADRVNFPLRRVGERGENKWERISWDEALDDISERMQTLKHNYGPGTLASMIGGPHTSFWPLHRFMTLFGSPNNMGIGQICWNPRIWMDILTFGWTVEADITPETGCVIIWGTNPAESDNSAFWRHLLKLGKMESPKIVVIDPRYTKTAHIADLWLAPNPGTDCVLALGMISFIIKNGLYDVQFVNDWCFGFDELAAHVEPYTLEHTSQITGVSKTDIATAATWFATLSPSALISGRGVDQVGESVSPTHRAICCLRAITANVDRPGACVLAEGSDFVPEADLELTLEHMSELSELCLNTPYTALQSYTGYEKIARLTASEPFNRKMPVRYLTSAHPDLVLRAMETGQPYSVRALIVNATNPLLTYADTHRVYNALIGLDLIVVLDYYLTPTAQIADFVLPAAGAIERPTFQAHGGVANMAYGGPRAVAPYYERKTDYEIFRELGIRLGQAKYWPEPTFEEACAYTLAPSGMTWEQYCQEGVYYKPPAYYKYLQPFNSAEVSSPDDPNPTDTTLNKNSHKGFATSTGKIELASPTLESLGGQRLPEPGIPRKLCTPDFIASRTHEGWHHVHLITGGRKQPYNASMYMNNPSFRQSYPVPLVEMSKKTADALGLAAGDTAILATDKGQARMQVAIINMLDNVIHADYGWWHPEWQLGDGRLNGIWESNINCLTSCTLDQSEKLIGTWSYNAIDCMIKKDEQ